MRSEPRYLESHDVELTGVKGTVQSLAVVTYASASLNRPHCEQLLSPLLLLLLLFKYWESFKLNIVYHLHEMTFSSVRRGRNYFIKSPSTGHLTVSFENKLHGSL